MGRPFFSQTLISGGHAASIELIAQKKADLAAIDAVTFAHLRDGELIDTDQVAIIGQSEYTTGLPFIAPKLARFDTDPNTITNALNDALSQIDDHHRQRLRVSHFETVAPKEYEKINQLKVSAEAVNYPTLA
ncbi:MAG: PhnD/SsuA/transferrin family substrate-binding protein [Gammaproteobacteria bacterium]|nr:PhnD/SsuA/transferrin family substrate-binding protein [Gammaproteobacteria bacterium]